MRTLGIFEAKNKLSEICEEVASSGEPTELSQRGFARKAKSLRARQYVSLDITGSSHIILE